MDERIKNDLQRLTKTRPGIQPLPGAATPAPILAKTALGTNSAVAAQAGIASPLTETAYADRTWHTEQNVTSTDGLFTLQVRAVNAITMTDANGSQVQLVLADPNA